HGNTNHDVAVGTLSVVSAEEETATQKIHRLWIWRDIAAACILVLVFFLIPAPTGQHNKPAMSSAQPSAEMIIKMMPKDITTGEPSEKAIKEAMQKTDSITALKKAMAEKKRGSEEEADTHSEYYTVVLASKVSKAGAERLVQKINSHEGMQACVKTGKSGTLVTHGSFETREQAQKERNKLTENDEFADCWVMHVK
uniref:SPOR domain-containing protein n=1 Tax=Prevotella sp. TaxID=59823 RepID=UPI00402669C5